MKTYTGGCHCGAVAFEATSGLETVMECNCSHCSKKGFLLTFIPAEQFTLLSGEENLTLYQFNRKHIEHLFCNVCGVESFARGKGKDGSPTIMLNVRCLNDIDTSTLSITPVDGKSF